VEDMTNGGITHFCRGVFKTMGCKGESSFTLRAHDKDISKLVPRSTHVNVVAEAVASCLK